MNWFQKLFGKTKEVVTCITPFSLDKCQFRFDAEANSPQVYIYSAITFRDMSNNATVNLSGVWVNIIDEGSMCTEFVLVHPYNSNLRSYEIGGSYSFETYKVFNNLYKKIKLQENRGA